MPMSFMFFYKYFRGFAVIVLKKAAISKPLTTGRQRISGNFGDGMVFLARKFFLTLIGLFVINSPVMVLNSRKYSFGWWWLVDR